MIDIIMEFLVDFAESALNILPDSPFANLNFDELGNFTQIMGWINYVIPVGTIVNILTVYLTCVLVWYGVRWLLRFAQYID